MEDYQFEWDDKKDKTNRAKHGLSFEDAVYVWSDPNKIIMPDLYHSETEERWIAIGFVQKVLYVIFTEKDEDVIRLISARIATKTERMFYNEYNKNIEGR